MLKTLGAGICLAVLLITAGSVGRVSHDLEIRNPVALVKRDEMAARLPRRIVVIAGDAPARLKTIDGAQLKWEASSQAVWFAHAGEDTLVGASRPGKYELVGALVVNGHASFHKCDLWAMEAGGLPLPGDLPLSPSASKPAPKEEAAAKPPQDKRLYVVVVYADDAARPAAFDSPSAKTLLAGYNVELHKKGSAEVKDAGLLPYLTKELPMLIVVKPTDEEAEVLYADRLPGSVEEVGRIAAKFK